MGSCVSSANPQAEPGKIDEAKNVSPPKNVVVPIETKRLSKLAVPEKEVNSTNPLEEDNGTEAQRSEESNVLETSADCSQEPDSKTTNQKVENQESGSDQVQAVPDVPSEGELRTLLNDRRRNSSLGSPQVARLKECRAVRVFISSTFRDFALERDYLMRHALPQLRKIGEERGVTVVFVDLRWGVTSDESSSGAVVKLCLREIDACRPFFVGMLGERYGWHLDPNKPPGSDPLLEQTMDIGQEFYPWVKGYRARSVTELEILHGALLDPMLAPHATFYFREHDEYMQNMSGEIPEEEIGVYEAESDYCRESQTSLKEQISLFFPDRIYRYNHVKSMSEQLVKDLTKAIDSEFKLEDGVVSEYFKLRMQHEAFAGSRKMGYVDPEELFKTLDDYCEANEDKGIAVVGQSGLGKSALLANWSSYHKSNNPKAILFVHYVGCTAESTDHYSMIRRLMGDVRERLLLQDTDTSNSTDLNENQLVEQLPDFLANAAAKAADAGQYLVIVIDALDQLEDKGHAHSLFWLPKVPNVRLVCSIKQNLQTVEVNGHTRSGSQIAEGNKTVLLEQDKYAADTPLLAAAMTANASRPTGSTRVKMSTDASADTLKYWLRNKWDTVSMRELNKAEQETVIVSYLATHAKKLDENQINMVLSAKPSSNPLYLRTLLDEARLFGNFFKLSEHLEGLLAAETSVQLYTKVLHRMADECGIDLVRNTVAMVLCARDGLNDDELREALCMSQSNAVWNTSSNISGIQFAKDNFQMLGDRDSLKFIQLLFALREQLCSMSGMMTFFHDAVKEAVKDFIGGDPMVATTHAKLAHYFTWKPLPRAAKLRPSNLETPREGVPLLTLHPQCDGQGSATSSPVHQQGDDEDELAALEQKNRRSLREFPYHASLAGQFNELADYLAEIEVMSALLQDESGKYELVRYWRSIDDHWQIQQQLLQSNSQATTTTTPFPIPQLDHTISIDTQPQRRSRKSAEDYLASIADEAAIGANFALRKASNNSLVGTPVTNTMNTPTSTKRVLNQNSNTREVVEEAAHVMNTIATVLVLLGKYDKAVRIREKELSINTTLYGEVHFKVSISCSELAKVYEKVYANYDHSMELKTRAVNIDRELLGPDHEELAIGYDNLAFLHLKLGQYEKAKELYSESLRIKEKTCGIEHRDVAQTLCSMGLMYEELGDYSSALNWYSRGLAIREKAFGPAHPSVARSLVDLGMLLMKQQNQFPAALEKLLHGYEILSSTLGHDHADVAAAANNLGLIYGQLKDFSAALRFHLEAKQIQSIRLGEDHPSFAATCSNIASVCQELADRASNLDEEAEYFHQAEEHYSNAIMVYKMKLGASHPDRATALHNMATMYFESGIRELERNRLRKQNTLNGMVFGKCKNDLGLAKKNFETAFTIRKEKLGANHPSCKASLESLRMCTKCLETGSLPGNSMEDDNLLEDCVADGAKLREITIKVVESISLDESVLVERQSPQFDQVLDIWAEVIGIDPPSNEDVSTAIEELSKDTDVDWSTSISIDMLDKLFKMLLVLNYV